MEPIEVKKQQEDENAVVTLLGRRKSCLLVRQPAGLYSDRTFDNIGLFECFEPYPTGYFW